MSNQFIWPVDDEPPIIESHTDAKLRVLEEYLRLYFEVVCALPKIDTLRIALVDSFAGGGMFRRDGALRHGSPLVFIDAVRQAEARVNANRRKPLKIEAKFFFVDRDQNTINYLRSTIGAANIEKSIRDNIIIEQGISSYVLPAIVGKIKAWTRTGRSIFFLDQCGYTGVSAQDIKLIYRSLPKSEIIATYNFGAIYDYMNDKAGFLTAMTPLDISPDQIRLLLKERGPQTGRYLAGRMLGPFLKKSIGSKFMSRFFLRSEKPGRDMWLVHYSKHPRSRLVMNKAHWLVKNASITQGDAGLDMLGFRPNWEDQIALDFGFSQSDEGRIHNALIADLPVWLDQFDSNEALRVDELLALSADNAAATQEQYYAALSKLETEREIEMLTPSGSRKRGSAQIRSDHRIVLSRQCRFIY